MTAPGNSAGEKEDFPSGVAEIRPNPSLESKEVSVGRKTQVSRRISREVRAAGVSLALAFAAGCGNQYRPVVSPITPTGPSPQPQAYAVVVTQPTNAAAGVLTLLDFAGDSVLAQVEIGNHPLDMTYDGVGSTIYTVNQDGSLSDIPISTSVQTKNVLTSTLNPNAIPVNALIGTGNVYVIDQNSNSVAVLTGSPAGLKQEIPVATGLINLAGRSTGTRLYAISQNVPLGTAANSSGTSNTVGACSNPSAVTTTGVASALEVSTNSISAVIPVGVCPVYGIASSDGIRTFILNRGSGTVSVINSQKNTLDTEVNPNGPTSPSGAPGTVGTITLPSGPVYAELYDPSSQLVTANYDANSISVIDVSTDAFYNDSPQFGTIHNVTVGTHPTAVTVLQDGTRAYVANSDDGTVSIVNLSSFTVEKVIPVSGHPRTIYSTYNYPIGKVYVGSPDTQNLTIIRTDTDEVSATLQMQGSIVNVRVSRQTANGSTQVNNDTQVPGNGVPCTIGTDNLPNTECAREGTL